MGGEPAHHILGETFYTQLPLRYGHYVAKLQLAPVSPALLALRDAPIELKQDNALREAVAAAGATLPGVDQPLHVQGWIVLAPRIAPPAGNARRRTNPCSCAASASARSRSALGFASRHLQNNGARRNIVYARYS